MNEAEWRSVPPVRMVRLLELIRNFGRRCVDCFEQLTLAERLEARICCTSCWPEETAFKDEISRGDTV